jgi:hypothetical protein
MLLCPLRPTLREAAKASMWFVFSLLCIKSQDLLFNTSIALNASIV